MKQPMRNALTDIIVIIRGDSVDPSQTIIYRDSNQSIKFATHISKTGEGRWIRRREGNPASMLQS